MSIGWMREFGLLVILFLSICQGKSLGSPHETFPFSTLLAQGSPNPSNAVLEYNTQTLGEQQPISNYDVVGSDPVNSIPVDSGPSMETALVNYLYMKNMLRRMRQQELEQGNSVQRKRTNGNYWKMCAFNAVSCFG